MRTSSLVRAGIVTASLAVGLALAVRTWAQGREDPLSLLDVRVAALEKVVIKDLQHPKDTVLARLETAENRLKEMERSDSAVEKRVASLEGERRRVAPGVHDPAVELQTLRRQVDTLTRTLDDVKERVRRLEGKVR